MSNGAGSPAPRSHSWQPHYGGVGYAVLPQSGKEFARSDCTVATGKLEGKFIVVGFTIGNRAATK
jgi:hypothetical protein